MNLPDSTKTAQRWRILWIALAASILLNAFFLGLMGVRCAEQTRGMDARQPPGRAAQERLVKAIAHLDPEYQDQVRQKVAVQDVVVTRESNAMMDLFAQSHAVLTAPQFDAARFDAFHVQIDQHDRTIKDGFSLTAKAIAQSLPDKERIRFFQAAFPDEKKSIPAK